MKRLIALAILALLTLIIGAVSAQDDSLIPSETYLQAAERGEWQVVDSENGVLTLANINPRLQYTMTYPRLWSVALDSASFIETWMGIGDEIPLEAILSFDTYNVRLLLGAPVVDEETGLVRFEAQVLEVINFIDETSKTIPTRFEFPMLTIQPTLDFTLALMDSANSRLAGTRNADTCATLYRNYQIASLEYDEVRRAPGVSVGEITMYQQAMMTAYYAYFNTCVGG